MSSISLIGSVVFKLNFESIIYDVLAGFDFGDSSNLSASARAEQFYALLHGWMDNPLFGSGHGAAALGVSEAMNRPGLTNYLILLFFFRSV